MKTKTIRQTVTFPATPEKVYALLLDGRKLTAIHGTKATISRKPKGKFSVFDGYCHGYNIALEENRKIEQAWVFREAGWPEDHYSNCTFRLEPLNPGTKLVFTQKGVPEDTYQALKVGWKTYYWNPMLQYVLKNLQ
jgi:activator of HSP90 ATPase